MNDRIHYVGSSSTCSGVVDGSLMDLNSSNCLNSKGGEYSESEMVTGCLSLPGRENVSSRNG